jgi:hypothetical protein
MSTILFELLGEKFVFRLCFHFKIYSIDKNNQKAYYFEVIMI